MIHTFYLWISNIYKNAFVFYRYRQAIWEIVGEYMYRMLYASILSKYSTFGAFDLFLRGGTKEANVLFGADNDQKMKFR